MRIGKLLAILVAGLSYSVFGQTEVVTNGGFESGSAGWELAGGVAVTPSTPQSPAHSGTASLVLGGTGSASQSAYQTITLPTNTVAATLSYYYRVETLDGQGVLRAEFWAAILDAATNLVDLQHESNIGQPLVPAYNQKTFDLSAYAGQTIRLQFEAATYGSSGTYFNVDDVSVLVVKTSDQPANDAFANRAQLTGTNVSLTASNTFATTETGEPNHAGQAAAASVWWTWTAPDYGNVSITTDGSSFDTLLAVYTGATVSNLTRVAANNNESDSGKLTSRVVFNASPGTQYQIAVDGANGETGTIQLRLRYQSNPFIPCKGVYPGLFSVSNAVTFANAGSVSLTVSDKGSFSSKWQLAGGAYSLSGKFDTNGTFSGSIQRKGLTPLPVQLQLDMSGGDVVTGQLSDGAWTADLVANRAVYSKTAPAPAPLNGKKYTLVIAGTEDALAQAGGYGFGSVKIDAAGKVSFSGALGDGTKVSQKTYVSKDGQWPLYLALYARKGSMQGWLTFTNETDANPSGFVSWTRLADAKAKLYPAGFSTNDLPVAGSLYTFTKGVPVLDLAGGGVVVLENGNLSQSVTNPCSLGINNKVTWTNKLSLSITAATGLFKGKVPNPATGKPITVSGAVLQNQNAGFGCFMGTNQSGRVYLGP